MADPKDNYSSVAKQIRRTVLTMLYRAQTSHAGSNLSVIDILTVIFGIADFKKDKLVVSKGWAAASVYALAAHHGLIPKEDLETYCQPGSKYIGLIEPLGFWGAEFAGGSMGFGLPAAVGFALAKKMKGEEGTVYCLMSDAELQIGTFWEALLIAKFHNLRNLKVLIDGNKLQAMGEIADILPSFDQWDASSFNGHAFNEIEKACSSPFMFHYAHTIKGKGVSFMENNNLYHYKNLSQEEYELALKELDGP